MLVTGRVDAGAAFVKTFLSLWDAKISRCSRACTQRERPLGRSGRGFVCLAAGVVSFPFLSFLFEEKTKEDGS
jgi:hypothetical protein